jgi:ABC-type transport system involved in cytochrome bd biosynthesis fused ATPase/permease subunit
MFKVSRLFKKSTALALLLTMGMAAFSVPNVFAASSSPTSSTATSASTALQANWKYEVASNAAEINFLNRLDQKIDLTKTIGNVDMLRNANLDRRDARVMRDANMVLGQENKIISAHAGFDANGNVTDQTQASQTIEQLGRLVDFYNGQLYFELRNIS